jgi:hypothetical protein
LAAATFAVSRSGSAKTRLSGFFRDLVFGIGDGLLSVADSFTGYSFPRRYRYLRTYFWFGEPNFRRVGTTLANGSVGFATSSKAL